MKPMEFYNGDEIKSRAYSKKGRDTYDKIFRKKKKEQKPEQKPKTKKEK